MDESWRMRMGLNSLPRRRSTEETSSDRLMMTTMRRNNNNSSRIITNESETSSSTTTTTSLDPENFCDVFGGPPRSIISRQFSSGDLITGNLKTSTETFYEGMFRSSEYVDRSKNNGKKILPSKKKKIDSGFYDDIFGSDDEDKRRSKWKSPSSEYSNTKNQNLKSNSSSVLSWEGELSPLRPSIAEDDVFFDTFTSTLRPVNIPGRRLYTSSMLVDEQHKKASTSDYPWISNNHENHNNQHDYIMNISNNNHNHNRMNSSTRFAFSHSISSPETISIDPNSCTSSSFTSNSVPKENGNPGESPSSVVSLQREYYPTFDQILKSTNRHHYQDYKMSPQEEEDHEEVMRSSYVIEISPERKRETNIDKRESVGIDEAIAWAKEKFQSQCAEIIQEITNHQQQQHLHQKISLRSFSPAKPITQREDKFLTRENGIRK
ncbi:probable myosin light chain kinase DDB_G0279831 isoform X2 [Papaver somniferum]|uniref:probable myosin light chain kinase DDB_G0279831 isoform X2 n=1 Tax=Papaver somniferum TaxID=3469 RepID=UPI000E6FF060|nr:probable myosin light chain kinase DDB_G0279831 isoform X2 [Papaver somniferum]